MIQQDILTSITDDDLFVTVQRLTARSNVALADLLAHLAEVERRGIHRLRACASLYTYCIYELRMSEDAAYRRSKAARLVREFPELHDVIAKGEIHLTGVLMIGPHLGGEHHAEVLRRARFRSKREILRLIAQIDPKPEVPALVEPIGPAPAGTATHRALVEALSGPVRELAPGSRPEDWITDLTDGATRCDEPVAVLTEDAARCDEPMAAVTDGAVPCDARMAGAESSHVRQPRDSRELRSPVDATEQRPLRYKVQFTASQEFVDLLQEASDLIGHQTPRATLPDIQLRALRVLVQQLRTRKYGATKVPSPARGSSRAAEAPARVPGVAADAAPERVPAVAPDAAPQRVPRIAPDAAPASVTGIATDIAPVHVVGVAPGAAPEQVPGAAPIAAPERVPGIATAAPARRGDRYIPAPVRRAVCDRDAGRCAYRDDRGERCRETRGLEIHHRDPYALGGPRTVDNLELRCRAHNTLAAEQDFGREHMDLARGVADRTQTETA